MSRHAKPKEVRLELCLAPFWQEIGATYASVEPGGVGVVTFLHALGDALSVGVAELNIREARAAVKAGDPCVIRKFGHLSIDLDAFATALKASHVDRRHRKALKARP
jgi:hypothetical protein